MDQKKTGKFLGEARKSVALTQEQLGEKLGVSQRTISRWETGKNLPDISMLPLLCDALGINVAEFMAGERSGQESFTCAEVSGLLPGLAELAAQKEKRRRLVGAVISLAVAVACMFALYDYAFRTDVSSTGDLERAIEQYHFAQEIRADVLERTAVRDRLFVLYRNRSVPASCGLAQLQKGIFGKYRMISAADYGYPLCNEEIVSVGRTQYLLTFCANELPGVTAFAYYPLDGEWNETDTPAYSETIEQFPFLNVTELRERPAISPYFAHYYGESGEEIPPRALEERFGAEDVSTSSVTSVELGMVYFFEIVILGLGLILVRYFLSGGA